MDRFDYFPEKGLIEAYRRTFTSGHGKEVLSHMLFDLGLFEQITDGAEDVSRKNYGLRLLQILSGGDVPKAGLDALLEQIVREPLRKE